MELKGADIATIVDILAISLPPDERVEFKQWTREVSSTDFWRVLPSFISEDEVKGAVAEYVASQLAQIEHFCGVEIHALVKVDGRTYVHGSFYEEYGC